MRAFFVYRLCLLFLLAGIKSTALATTITSIACGKWTDLQTWNLGRIPNATDTICVRHFVAFDTDFTSIAPGLLRVDSSGTLCGPIVYKGHFLLNGPAYLGRLEIYYGRSHNYSSLKVRDQIQVYGNGAWEVHFPACIGCYPGCDSCTVTPILAY